ncbi:hypothetical protein FRC07_008292 [Ceratobasidium sp. 392]|nr:hypothetical protein FRC07_008292 [Ceratobasidium sp. 392]
MEESLERAVNILVFGEHSYTAFAVFERALMYSDIEGGLAGGLSSLIMFRELMARIRAASGSIEIIEHFDMIAGTGTGALIACMLGLLRIDIDQAITAYSGLVESVFSDKKVISTSGSGMFKASILEEQLKKIVRDATGDENARMMKAQQDESGVVFAMAKYNMNASTPRIFRSYQGPNNQMPNCPIWQVLRATMAHPEMFDSIEIGEVQQPDSTCPRGREVSAIWPERRITSVVCVGAGHARTIEIPKSNPLHKIVPTNVLIAMKNIVTDSERVAQEMALRFEGTSDLYFRFNVDQGMQDMRMSHWQRKSEVAARTRTYMQKPEVTGQMSKAVGTIVARRGTLKGASIGGKVQQSPVQRTTGVKRCPAPSPAFTGPVLERRVCIVHGLGGSGKTQVALKAVEQTRDTWSDIVYVDATSRETTVSTLKGFALARKVGETHEDALRWLESFPQPWLMVFDNADDQALLGLADFIPGGSHGSVLITTRLRALAMLGHPIGLESNCMVGKMEAKDALELLLLKAQMQNQALSDQERGAATQLVEEDGVYDMGNELLNKNGQFSSGPDLSPEVSRDLWRSPEQVLRNSPEVSGDLWRQVRIAGDPWKSPAIWQVLLTYERLRPLARRLLGLILYLHYSGITEDIFKRAAKNTDRPPIIPPDEYENTTREYLLDLLAEFLDADGSWDSSVFLTAMDELLSYSLIDYDRMNESYTLHVLVQDWARTAGSHSKIMAQAHTSHLLALSIDRADDTEAHAYRSGLILHVSKLWETLSSVNDNDANYFAMVYDESGRWDKAEHQQKTPELI